ncbi:MAG: hypothetical protein B6A08_05120 [Sorangiineae bacterium NIC37A_2]|nr:MAG: hypothetical protein B6A08_05120 [Sorangiineae bacterium NIC37A_2]
MVSPNEPSAHATSLGFNVGDIVSERYQIRRLIGRGGMGVVYEAEHVHMKKRVALKVLHTQHTLDADLVQRFEREAVLLGRLDHPGVVTASDFGQLPSGAFFLVLEYVDGERLAQVIKRTGPMPPSRAFRIAVQINAALVAAHSAGIVHRDLKPDNVMLVATDDDDDFVKVLDFGIAKIAGDAAESRPGITRAGTVFGTPEYMAPEQARGDIVDYRADLYALGMILYEMLTGTSAFRNSDMVAVLTAQMMDTPKPLPDTVPAELAALTMKLLEKSPEDRPDSAVTLAAAFAAVAHSSGFELPTPRTSAGTRLDLAGVLAASRTLPTVTEQGASRINQLRELSLRPVAFPGSRRKLPLFVPVLALLGGLALGASLTLLGTRASPKKKEPSVVPTTRPTDDPTLLTRAELGDREALTSLRRLTERDLSRSERSEDDLTRAQGNLVAARRFLALGRGFSVIRHYPAALEFYSKAVKLDSQVATNPDLIASVRLMLEQRETVDDALTFARTYLGEVGADLIYDVWRDNLGQPNMTPVVAKAQRLVRHKDLSKQASRELAVALDLERAQYCGDFRDILPRAVTDADERSLPKLRVLAEKSGCGPTGRDDCFVCLRKPDVPLEEAIRRAEGRKAPAYTLSTKDGGEAPE